MGKKNTTRITENEGSGKPRALWPDDLVAILCEICVKEATKGNRPPGTHFDKIGWVNVVNVFKEMTGRDYGKRQLKSKWDALKTDWKLWSSQLRKQTGIGWDPTKKMVDAPPKWWQRKIEMHFEYPKKGKKGKLGGSEHDKQTDDKENEEASQDDQDRGKKRTNDESKSTTTSSYRSSQGTSIAEMGKKNTTSFTENEGSGKPKAIWSDDLVAILCEICVKEVAKGNRSPGTHFDKIEWVNVVNVFKEITGRDYDQRQLQNKWAKLKINWKLWSSHLHKETGIGWDPAKKMVDAPPKWWQRKIEMHVDYLKKGKKGKLGGSKHDKQTVDRENVEASQDDQDRGKKRTNDESEINKEVVGGSKGKKAKLGGAVKLSKQIVGGSKGKKAKLGGAVKLSKQIDHHVEVVESTSTATPVYRSSQGTSIPGVMEVVATLPGAERGSQLWWFATELFCSQDKREMFCVMTDPDLKLQFLIRNQKKSGN